MDDPEWSTEVLSRVTDLGVMIAIDDFGTGHSSLSRLKTLPVHVIKIDRSFVMNMHADDHDAAVVRAAIDLARAFGHVAVAEGVESDDCWERLRRLGCDRIQGYVLSAAIPITQTHHWLGLPGPAQQPRELSLTV
jgi:EAL domain-containing protein (putative c-di-GMP-specific phosphodiesterase class I)